MGATAARADDWNDGYEHGAVPVNQHVHNGCHRPVAPPPQYTQQQGRYELQNVQRWVPGQQQQVWVPGQCFGHHRRWKRCTNGYYRTEWTPGSYVTVQEWVWVPYANNYQYGASYRYQGASFTMQAPQATAQIRVGF